MRSRNEMENNSPKKPKESLETLVRITLCSLAFAAATSLATPVRAQEEPANVTTLKIQEKKRIVFEPYVGAVRGDFKVDHPSSPKYEARWTGIQFGVRMFADATSNRTLLVGFDLRQRYGWTDDFDAPLQNPDARETSLGVRLDWHPLWPVEPVFGLGWNFGDLWRLKTQEKSYTGNALTLSGSIPLGFGRVYVEGEFGQYKEGSGFIYTGTLGDGSMKNTSVSIGVVYALDVPAPDWLAIGTPTRN